MVQESNRNASTCAVENRESATISARSLAALDWTIVALFGALQGWSHRLFVDHDGVNYLDIARQYSHGAWRASINAYWSPLYSWLLAISYTAFGYSRQWDSTFLHLINLIAYLAAYASFRFLLTELLSYLKDRSNEETVCLERPSWRLLGLGLFLYSSLVMSNHAGSTPDILVVAFVYLATGLILRALSNPAPARIYALLGVTLAFSYFAKTAMFPISLVFLMMAAVVSYRRQESRLSFILAPICFALVAMPWVIVLSQSKGRPTFGDTGRLAYAGLVKPFDVPLAWQGQVGEEEHLLHPPRVLMAHPSVIEFATPVAGTFPLWYDGSYWLEGRKAHFSLRAQVHVLRGSIITYFRLLENQREYLFLALVLLLLGGSVRAYVGSFLRLWFIWLPAAAAIGMYALVLVEPRYVAPFVVVLWLSLFAAFRIPRTESNQIFIRICVVAAVATTGLGVTFGGASDLTSILRPRKTEQIEVALELHRQGLVDGQRVAIVGTSRDSFEWARLAGLRIVALIPSDSAGEYWHADTGTKQSVNTLLSNFDVVALITDAMPDAPFQPHWSRLGQTSYFISFLSSDVSRTSAKPKNPDP